MMIYINSSLGWDKQFLSLLFVLGSTYILFGNLLGN